MKTLGIYLLGIFIAIATPIKIVQETVEIAIKKSGKILSVAAKESIELATQKAATKYGDEILKIVQNGGIEIIEQIGKKNGDEIVKLCIKNPGATRSLALHADELLPLVKICGENFLIVEAKVPGLAKRVFQEFGGDGIKKLTMANANEISQLIGFAGKTKNITTKELLLQAFEKNGEKFLLALDWKKIMAGGLSIASIISAYKISGGIKDGLLITAENSPETFAQVVTDLSFPVRIGIYILILVLLLPIIKISICFYQKIHNKDTV